VTVRTVTEDNSYEVGGADDDIEPIDGGVKPEKSGRLPSPFSRAENRYSKGRPITETQMQERVNDAYMLMMKLDFAGERAEFLNQVNNMRMHTVKKALKRGNFQVVAQLLDSLGRAMGEGSIEEAANAAPNLNITIEDKRGS
jgi:hypothetical protein